MFVCLLVCLPDCMCLPACLPGYKSDIRHQYPTVTLLASLGTLPTDAKEDTRKQAKVERHGEVRVEVGSSEDGENWGRGGEKK